MNKVVRNERKKLTATWFNNFATGIMTAGVLGPAATLIYGSNQSGADIALIFTVFAICMLVSGGLHLAGRSILWDLEE